MLSRRPPPAGAVLGDMTSFEALELLGGLRRSWDEWDSEGFRLAVDRLARALEACHWTGAREAIPDLPGQPLLSEFDRDE